MARRARGARAGLIGATPAAREVESADAWVQFDGAEVRSQDVIIYALFYAFTSSDRELTVEGTVHR